MDFSDDIEIVKSLRLGDRIAFKCLFEKYYDRLVAFIVTYSHDKIQAEEVVQQTFITLWENKLKLDSDKSPKAYLYTIAYNKYIDSIKNLKKQEKLLHLVWENALRNRIEEDTEAIEERIKKMKDVIEELPPKCKKIIVMNKMQGVKYKDISELLGISVKTVESQMRIAFTKIREAFKDDQLMLFILFGYSVSPIVKNKTFLKKGFHGMN